MVPAAASSSSFKKTITCFRHHRRRPLWLLAAAFAAIAVATASPTCDEIDPAFEPCGVGFYRVDCAAAAAASATTTTAVRSSNAGAVCAQCFDPPANFYLSSDGGIKNACFTSPCQRCGAGSTLRHARRMQDAVCYFLYHQLSRTWRPQLSRYHRTISSSSSYYHRIFAASVHYAAKQHTGQRGSPSLHRRRSLLITASISSRPVAIRHNNTATTFYSLAAPAPQ